MNSEPQADTVPPPPLDQGGMKIGPAASRGLASMLGLDPRTAALAILVDLMLFGGDAASLGLFVPFGAAVAAVLGFTVYRIQLTRGDAHDAALIKALSIGLLTAIPVPLTPIIAIPGGILGLVRATRRT
jgi:hypothetical protein